MSFRTVRYAVASLGQSLPFGDLILGEITYADSKGKLLVTSPISNFKILRVPRQKENYKRVLTCIHMSV